MDSEYRCKCGKPMSLPNQLCSDCGSLGPHLFLGRSDAPVEPVEERRTARHRESYTPQHIEEPQKPSRHEKYSAPPPGDEPVESRHSTGRIYEEDDSRFPAGMRSHSPILDHIRDLNGEQPDRKKHAERERPQAQRERSEHISSYSNGDEDEMEHAQPPKPEGNNMVSIIVSVVLVLALLIAAFYVINNFEEVTKWLASPTVPEIFKPSAE